MIDALGLVLALALTAVVLAGWGRIVFRLVGVPGPARFSVIPVWVGVFAASALVEFANFLVPIDWTVTLGFSIVGVAAALAGTGAAAMRAGLAAAADAVRGHPLVAALAVAALALLCLRTLSPPDNYDTGLYHLQSIRWLNEFRIVPGLGNLLDRLAHNESFFGIVALANAAPLWGRGYAMTGLFLLGLTGVTTVELRPRTPAGFWIVLASGLALALRVEELSSPASDLAVTLVEMALFLLLIRILSGPPGDDAALPGVVTVLCLAVLLLTLKLSAAVFLALSVAVASPSLMRPLGRHRMAAATLLTLLAAVVTIHIARGYVLSGVPLYPATFAGAWDLPWAMTKSAVQSEANWIYSWARLPNHPPSEVLGNWRWLGAWIAAFPARGWMLIGGWLALAAIHAGLLWTDPRPARDRRLFLLNLPLLGGLVFWFLTAPTLRLLGAIPELGIGLAGYLCLRRLEETGRLRPPPSWPIGSAACASIAVALFVLVPAMFGRLSFAGWQPIPTVATTLHTAASGLRISGPVSGDQCWNAPLPCAGYFRPDLRLLGPTLQEGFTRRPPT